MKNTIAHKTLFFVLCITMVLSAAAFMTGCGTENTQEQPSGVQASAFADGSVLGEGSTSFTVEIIYADETSKSLTVNSDKTNLKEALTEINLIDGEADSVGFYVTTVDGIAFDYDKDGCYWGLYINDTMANVGIDEIKIEEGTKYTFKAVR